MCFANYTQTSTSLWIKSLSKATDARTRFFILLRLQILMSINFGTAKTDLVRVTFWGSRLAAGRSLLGKATAMGDFDNRMIIDRLLMFILARSISSAFKHPQTFKSAQNDSIWSAGKFPQRKHYISVIVVLSEWSRSRSCRKLKASLLP